VHVTALPRDYYHRDAAGTSLTGEHSRHVYRLTDTLKVRLVGVNVEERKIDFVPAEHDDSSAQPRGKNARRGQRRGK